MKMFVALLSCSAVLGIGTGCGGNDWPANIESNFLNSCEAQGSRSKCECALANLKEKMTADQFEAAEKALVTSGTADSRITDAIAACK
jgi:hypothetical protein